MPPNAGDVTDCFRCSGTGTAYASAVLGYTLRCYHCGGSGKLRWIAYGCSTPFYGNAAA